ESVKVSRAAPGGDVDAVVESLFVDYEQTGDAVLRLLALESRLPAIKTVTDIGRREHRQWVADAFAAPLGSMSQALRQRTLDALVIATDVYTWKLLRRDMGRGVKTAMNTVKS